MVVSVWYSRREVFSRRAYRTLVDGNDTPGSLPALTVHYCGYALTSSGIIERGQEERLGQSRKLYQHREQRHQKNNDRQNQRPQQEHYRWTVTQAPPAQAPALLGPSCACMYAHMHLGESMCVCGYRVKRSSWSVWIAGVCACEKCISCTHVY
jgi:hypothetical protein